MSLQHFFQAILQTSIMAGVLVILILLVNLIVGNWLGMRWRYLLWMLVIVRLLLPYSIESKVSIFNLTETIEQEITSEWSKPVFIVRTIPSPDYVAPEKVDTQIDPSEALKPVRPDEKPVSGSFVLLDLLAMVWLGGAVLFAIHALYVNIRFWCIIRKAGAMLNMRAYQILDETRRIMKIHTPIPLVESDLITCPALFGFVRPRLIMPKSIMETLTDEELRFIMMHELAHFKQNDILIGWLTMVLRVLHWFNPFLWYAFYRIRQDREISCDMIALGHMDRESSIRYGKTLIKLVENYKKSVELSGMAGIIEGSSPLKKRILAIKTHQPLGILRGITAAALFLMIILVTLTNPVQAGNSIIPGQLTSGALENSTPAPTFMDTLSPTPSAADPVSPTPTARDDIRVSEAPIPETQAPPEDPSPSALGSESFTGFSDSRMEAAIRVLLNKPEGDLNPSDIQAISSLTIIGSQVDEGFGSIVGFTENGYTYMNGLLSNARGNIQNLSDIGKLSNLSTLEIDWQEGLDPFTLTFPPILRDLRLRCDGITDLSFLSGQNKLQVLILEFNAIADAAPLADLTNLRQLSLLSNRIEDISPLGRLTNLDWLDISKNLISDTAPLAQLKALRYLYVNYIKGFDLNTIAGLSELTDLGLSHCELKNLEGIQAFKNLEQLNIDNNQLSDIQLLAELPHLRILNLTNNPIEDYSVLLNMPSLRKVILQDFRDTALIQKLEEKGIEVLR